LNTDKAFDKNITNQYRLSIQVSLDGFSFLVLAVDSRKVISAKKTPVKISSHKLTARHFSDWVREEPMLNQSYAKVEIFLFEELFTLVPDSVDPGRLAEVLINPENDRKIFQNKIAEPEASLLFSVYNEFAGTVFSHFRNSVWVHPVSVLLNSFPNAEKPNTGILIQSQNLFFFILKKRNRLLLANCFKAEHSADFLYFLVNTFKQMEVSRNLTLLNVAGTNDNTEKLKQLLTPYFPAISELKSENETIAQIENISQLHLLLANKLN